MIDTTGAITRDANTGEEAAAAAARYHIDVDWYARRGLSFEDVVRARMSDASRARLGTEMSERVPVMDKGNGRMRMEERTTTFGSDPIKVIREHDSRAKHYIHRDLPTLEAVFRVLLANGNRPMTLDEVRESLAEWCPGGGCQWLLLPVESLQRLVEHDHTYGLKRIEGAGA